MKFFWTQEYNSGKFYYWKSQNEEGCREQALSVHGKTPFDVGETSETTYNLYSSLVKKL
jgi:hypothetical protein